MENWLGVAGYQYEVSDLGRVRSLPRNTTRGKVLKLLVKHGYHYAALCRNGQVSHRRVSNLVLEAFRGPREAGQECRHLNGNRQDDRLVNLTWGTRSENSADQVAHGTHRMSRRSVCSAGHEYPEDAWNGKLRVCPICKRDRRAEWWERRKQSGITCERSDCGGPAYAKGLCRSHYAQQWRNARYA